MDIIVQAGLSVAGQSGFVDNAWWRIIILMISSNKTTAIQKKQAAVIKIVCLRSTKLFTIYIRKCHIYLQTCTAICLLT